jgi:hypothetical protein
MVCLLNSRYKWEVRGKFVFICPEYQKELKMVIDSAHMLGNLES